MFYYFINMFENHHIYRIIRLVIFAILTYLALNYIPTNQINGKDLIKMTIILTILFIIIDCYYPNIYFD